MTEGRCGMCRWWYPLSDNVRWAECQMATNYQSQSPPSHKMACAYSEPPRMAWLMTRRGFGCVMWEAKETADG